MIDKRVILTPYVFKKKMHDNEYIGNLLNNKCFIRNTESIEKIINYFTELKSIPQKLKENVKLIERLVEMKVLVNEESLMLPLPNVELEITNYCNSSCVICPREKLSRKKGFMSEDTFSMVISELKKLTVNEVEICGVGEPLLHKNVAKYIKKLKDIGIKRVKMVTNASLLSEDKGNELVDAGLDSIMISFHTIDPYKYSKMMRGLNYNNVLENIKKFINKYNMDIETIITCVICEDNFKEINEFKRFWNEFEVNDLYFQNLQSRAGKLCNVKNPVEKYKCPVLEQGLFISFEGEYLSCSNDFSGESSWGNISDIGFEKCLNHKLDIIRSQSLFEFCKYCDYDFHEQQYLNTDFYKYVTYEGVKK